MEQFSERQVMAGSTQWGTRHIAAIEKFVVSANVGFLAQGAIHMQYGDGCVVEFTAPQVLVIDPGHDGWVVGDQPAVLIEFDFLGDTVKRFGLPIAHSHA